jgi:hypothetical protein
MIRQSSTHEGKRTAYRVFVGNPEGNKRLGRCTHRWEHNIKMNLGGIR